MRFFAPLALMLALGALFWAGLGSDPTVVPSPLVGKPMPAFTLSTLDDPTDSVSRDDLHGRVFMLHVWATWCESCRAEHPTLLAFSQRGLVPIVGLNYKDERDAARRWLVRAGDPYTMNLFDGDGRVGIDWGVYGTPETFIVDAEGIIRYKHVGPLDPARIEDELVPLLQELGAGR